MHTNALVTFRLDSPVTLNELNIFLRKKLSRVAIDDWRGKLICLANKNLIMYDIWRDKTLFKFKVASGNTGRVARLCTGNFLLLFTHDLVIEFTPNGTKVFEFPPPNGKRELYNAIRKYPTCVQELFGGNILISYMGHIQLFSSTRKIIKTVEEGAREMIQLKDGRIVTILNNVVIWTLNMEKVHTYEINSTSLGNVIEYKPGNIVVTTTQELLFWNLSTHEFRSKHVGVSDYVGHCTALNEPGSFIVQRQRRITLYKEEEEICFIDNSSLVNWPGSLIELEPFVVVTQTDKNTISVIDLQTRKVLRRYPMKGYLRYFVLE